MKKLADSQKGYIISLVMFFMMVIMLSIALTMTFLVINRQKSIANTFKSTQAYYASESGIEDALVRLKKTPEMAPITYDLIVNGATTTVAIPNIVGGSRAITSQGSNSGMTRKLQTAYSIDSTSTHFYYGAQIGAGGLIMSNGSRIMGNVFSGGDIVGLGTIDNDIVVSGNGHSINNVTVNGNALVYSCLSNARVSGNLTYVTGGTHACEVGGTTAVQTQEVSEQPLPIPQTQIDEWKSEAAAIRTITGNVNITNGQSLSLGPVKITGSLSISNNSKLTLTGTVYVVGNIYLSNSSIVKLDSSYNTLGGVLISDGTIGLSNNITFSGSGQTGSYLLVLSTSVSDLAINISNNSTGSVVFYAGTGTINIANNVSVIEATGYKIKMSNNSVIQYSSGIVNIYFTSGPGGGWKVTNWQEY